MKPTTRDNKLQKAGEVEVVRKLVEARPASVSSDLDQEFDSMLDPASKEILKTPIEALQESEEIVIQRIGGRLVAIRRSVRQSGISKARQRQVETIAEARRKREIDKQDVGYNSRPFVLCGLPLRRPKGVFTHTRRNGKFILEVQANLKLGLPFGQDRLIPIWVATLAMKQQNRVVKFGAAAEILREFGLPCNGNSYRRLIEGFQRIFGATIFFGTESQLEKDAIWAAARFHFFDKVQLWFHRDVDTPPLPGNDFHNFIVLSERFWEEVKEHPIPVDMETVRALAHTPGALDLYMWLSYRCWTARGKAEIRIPLFGSSGLIEQLGVQGYEEPRFLRRTIKRWLKTVKGIWPECPAEISANGDYVVIRKQRQTLPAVRQS